MAKRFICEYHGREGHGQCPDCANAAKDDVIPFSAHAPLPSYTVTFGPALVIPTPIADAFAYGRAVDSTAMALIRKLETDRAELVQRFTGHPGVDNRTAFDICTKFPLDKV